MRPTELHCFGAVAVLLAATAFLLSPKPAQSADPAAGRGKAAACQPCHGMDGMAKLPEAPHIAGQNEIYLVKALKDYRTGARKNEMMSLIVRELSDKDMLDLAAYYGRIEFRVKAP
jgi:cytochrome c553